MELEEAEKNNIVLKQAVDRYKKQIQEIREENAMRSQKEIDE